MPRERDELLTVRQVLDELGVDETTFYRWRRNGKAPRAFKLPNGKLRIRRSALNAWLDSLEGEAL